MYRPSIYTDTYALMEGAVESRGKIADLRAELAGISHPLRRRSLALLIAAEVSVYEGLTIAIKLQGDIHPDVVSEVLGFRSASVEMRA